MKNFEMAHSDDPTAIVKAAQRSVIKMLKEVITGIRVDGPKVPGLTWEQIDYLLDEAAKKEPTIIQQEEIF